MYETETTPKQPINQLQNNDGHSGAKALLADDGCCVVLDRGSREHNNQLIVAELQSECTNLTSLMLTNGEEKAVMDAPVGGGAALFKYTFLESRGIN